MRNRTKSLGITIRVKEEVADRDSFYGHPCCLWCGLPAPASDRLAFSNAHYVPRSQGGLGVERNIVTLCPTCHRRYDQSTDREKMGEFLRDYLKKQYEDWDESQLYYRKDVNEHANMD